MPRMPCHASTSTPHPKTWPGQNQRPDGPNPSDPVGPLRGPASPRPRSQAAPKCLPQNKALFKVLRPGFQDRGLGCCEPACPARTCLWRRGSDSDGSDGQMRIARRSQAVAARVGQRQSRRVELGAAPLHAQGLGGLWSPSSYTPLSLITAAPIDSIRSRTAACLPHSPAGKGGDGIRSCCGGKIFHDLQPLMTTYRQRQIGGHIRGLGYARVTQTLGLPRPRSARGQGRAPDAAAVHQFVPRLEGTTSDGSRPRP